MNRKDYELVAGVIRSVTDTHERHVQAICFADAFGRHDANFNRDKFLMRALGKRGANGSAT